jgi:hypothetical protein
MEPATVLTLAKAAMHSAEFIKKTFFDDRKIDELKSKTHENVSSLAEQVALNKAIVEQLVEQFDEGKNAIARHNEILLSLGQAVESTALEVRKLKRLVVVALVLAAGSGVGVVLLLLK